MLRLMATLGVATMFGLGLGWLSVRPHTLQAAPRPADAPPRRLERPGESAATAAAVLIAAGGARRDAGRPPRATPADAYRAPEPAAPDVAAEFRAELAAISGPMDGRQALLIGPAGRRVLASGDVYRSGWRVAAIGPGEVLLTRGAEIRRVDLFAR